MKKNLKITIAIFIALLIIIPVYMYLRSNHIFSNAVISNESEFSSRPMIVLDSEDNPHIAWYTSKYKVSSWYDSCSVNYITKHDNHWVNAAGEKYRNSNSSINSLDARCSWDEDLLTLDENNNPHLTWIREREGKDNPKEVHHVTWKDDAWRIMNGQEYSTYLSAYISDLGSALPYVVVSKNGSPHLLWTGSKSTRSTYEKWDGEKWASINNLDEPLAGWKFQVQKGSVVKLDSNNNPCVMWMYYDDEEEYYCFSFIRWNGKEWTNVGGEAYYPADYQEWQESTNKIKCGTTDFCVLFFDFELDENDNPHIVWFRTTVEDGPYLTYGVFSYTKWNGEEWVNINNKPYNPDQVDCPSGLGEWTARGISFELDGEGKPHFTWEDFSDNVIYSKWDGKNWVNVAGKKTTEKNANVSRNKNDSAYTSLALDSKGNPHIVWESKSLFSDKTSICYVWWDGKNWVNYKGKKY